MDVAVEEIAGDEQEHVLATMRQLPIDRDRRYEEEHEIEAVEDH